MNNDSHILNDPIYQARGIIAGCWNVFWLGMVAIGLYVDRGATPLFYGALLVMWALPVPLWQLAWYQRREQYTPTGQPTIRIIGYDIPLLGSGDESGLQLP